MSDLMKPWNLVFNAMAVSHQYFSSSFRDLRILISRAGTDLDAVRIRGRLRTGCPQFGGCRAPRSADLIVSLLINTVINWGTWSLLRGSFAISLAGVPVHVATDEVKSFLAAQPGVKSIHVPHIWSINPTETALTCHLVMNEGRPGDAFLHDVADEMEQQFRFWRPL